MAGYSVESLKEGIEKCKVNIIIFEEAQDRERDTIKEYRFMIETIERKKIEAANSVIEIVAERE